MGRGAILQVQLSKIRMPLEDLRELYQSVAGPTSTVVEVEFQ